MEKLKLYVHLDQYPESGVTERLNSVKSEGEGKDTVATVPESSSAMSGVGGGGGGEGGG